MAKQQIRIVYQLKDGQWCEMWVNEDRAQEEMDKLRSQPEVKPHTVRLSM